jgi:hypothetical protein
MNTLSTTADLPPLALTGSALAAPFRRVRTIVEYPCPEAHRALETAQQSLVAALALGLQIPPDLADGINGTAPVGRIEYDLATTGALAALYITETLVPIEPYRLLTIRAAAGEFDPFHTVDNDRSPRYARSFPHWRHRDHILPTDLLVTTLTDANPIRTPAGEAVR